MKVQAKTTIKVLHNEELETIFIKDKTYNANENIDLGWGYTVTDELGQKNLYCDDAFNSAFRII